MFVRVAAVLNRMLELPGALTFVLDLLGVRLLLEVGLEV